MRYQKVVIQPPFDMPSGFDECRRIADEAIRLFNEGKPGTALLLPAGWKWAVVDVDTEAEIVEIGAVG